MFPPWVDWDNVKWEARSSIQDFPVQVQPATLLSGRCNFSDANLCQGSVYRPKRCVSRAEYGSFSLKRPTNIVSQREDGQEEAKP